MYVFICKTLLWTRILKRVKSDQNQRPTLDDLVRLTFGQNEKFVYLYGGTLLRNVMVRVSIFCWWYKAFHTGTLMTLDYVCTMF